MRKGGKKKDAKIGGRGHAEESCTELEVSAGHLTVWSPDRLHQNLPESLLTLVPNSDPLNQNLWQ